MKPSKTLINRMRQDLMSKTSDAEKAAIRKCELLGYKVVRQQPIMTGRKLYFADIYLPELKVIMEIDGGYHDALLVSFFETTLESGFSAYVLYEGMGAGDGFMWSDPEPAGEETPLI